MARKPFDANSWEFLQRIVKINHNRNVKNYFKDIRSDNKTNTGRAAIKTALLIRDADSALEVIVKQNYFAQLADPVISFPTQFQTRVLPEVSQLAIIFRPTDKNSRSGNYTLHIPHYNGIRTPNIPKYKKGNYWAKFTCTDKSSVIVYASSKAEAIRVAKSLNRYVKPKYKSDEIQPSTGFMAHTPFKELIVEPIRADYYPKGKQNRITPEWRYYFKK